MQETSQKIDLRTAQDLFKKYYGLKGTLFALPGEIDQNFGVKIKGETRYIFKISKTNPEKKEISFQEEILTYLSHQNSKLPTPKIVPNLEGFFITQHEEKGEKRLIRLLTWVPGRLFSQVNPVLDSLTYDLGIAGGAITEALFNFSHDAAHHVLDWDIAKGLWTADHLNLFDNEKKGILQFFIARFKENLSLYQGLRKSIVHNDINDNNIIVSKDLIEPKIEAIIDFGDAVYTQTINDLAIACAYAIMHCNDPLQAALPLIKGYHRSFPLEEAELEHLYTLIAMRLVISVTKSAINKIEEPENTYLQISEKPAWDLLTKWQQISPDFAHFCFRKACGYAAHPQTKIFKQWAKKQNLLLTNLFPSIDKNMAKLLDLSVGSEWVGHVEEFNDLEFFQFKINRLQKENPTKILAGGYLEPRALYTSDAYGKIGNKGKESRTIHLGIDFWLPEKTPVHALFNGEVVIAVNDSGEKEYGGLIVLKHLENGMEFFSLYGHLTVASALKYKIGDSIKKGEYLAELGNYPENGNWAPHLHFQLMLSLLDYQDDFPGVTYPSQMDIWKELCPNPNLFFNLNPLKRKKKVSEQSLLKYRKTHLGKGMSLQYREPIQAVRGAGPYLMDGLGRKYLDTVNNVAHVGHENFEIVKRGRDQMSLLNTNTRYLHKNINELAKALLKTFPKELSVVHFVNSGSEANELALRMIKTCTGEKDIIASEVGYHGNTNACVDVSSYKFDGKGGKGKPPFTHIFPLPDQFRGKYRGPKSGSHYAEDVQKCIDQIHKNDRGVAGMIVESIISCGGQIELPQGFLEKSFEAVRKAGGLCIADEVQVGCGRVGKTFWGFELHKVVPDIVTIGKPLGNGHPLAAVVCTREVAEKFANGMEYFNTFGGNPVSCAIGKAVLDYVEKNDLQNHALAVGNYLKDELIKLSRKFPIVGDVRGQGLFLGFELVNEKLEPLPQQTSYLVNRMKEFGILMSIDGLDHNVVKIKPPMIFNTDHANELIQTLKIVFKEDFMRFGF